MSEIEDKVIVSVYASYIQNLVEPNVGRKLTEKELEKFKYAIYENSEASWDLDGAIIETARDIINNPKSY